MKYKVVEKDKSDFQKSLNQWRHEYTIIFEWIKYYEKENIYRAVLVLYKRDEK